MSRVTSFRAGMRTFDVTYDAGQHAPDFAFDVTARDAPGVVVASAGMNECASNRLNEAVVAIVSMWVSPDLPTPTRRIIARELRENVVGKASFLGFWAVQVRGSSRKRTIPTEYGMRKMARGLTLAGHAHGKQYLPMNTGDSGRRSRDEAVQGHILAMVESETRSC
jgi:hypothetical protein